jgi:hypothetical protein
VTAVIYSASLVFMLVMVEAGREQADVQKV